jgi:hypothetical protein
MKSDKNEQKDSVINSYNPQNHPLLIVEIVSVQVIVKQSAIVVFNSGSDKAI